MPKPPIGDVGATFRSLAEEHAQKREPSAREVNWLRLQLRLRGERERHVWSFSLPSFRLLPAAAVLGLGVAAAALLIPKELKYRLRGASAVDGTIRPSGSDGAIDFSDGSRIQLGRGSSLKVDVRGAHGADAVLATGELDVQVHHHDDTHYRFVAGPYEVRVVGTEFHVTWRPDSQLFAVVMKEGRVRVLGPSGLDRFLSTGESLRITGLPEAPSAAANQTPAAEPASAAPPSQAAARAPVRGNAGAPRGSDTSAELANNDEHPNRPLVGEADGRASWASLVAKGRFSDVVSEAETLGLDRSLHERPVSELNALAHAANYTGRTGVAISTWETLRQRFAGQPAARQAAFFIGRIQDQRGNASEALRWLNTYLAESPRDVYASEALGRKLLVVQKLEGAAAARRLAREYVERYPSGSYAQTARGLLSAP